MPSIAVGQGEAPATTSMSEMEMTAITEEEAQDMPDYLTKIQDSVTAYRSHHLF
jgi:hypothetical protein